MGDAGDDVEDLLERARAGDQQAVASLFDRYRPRVDSFLDHVEEVRTRSRFDDSVVPGRVARVRAVAGGFEVDGSGPFQHVLLAPGHPGLSMPAEWAGDPRVVHAYLPHDYGRRTAIVGAGMAAATEWLNALAAGSEVVSVRRREPERRPLNLPRPLFSRRGLAAFHASSPPERIGMLTRFSAPSYPPGRQWDEPIEAAVREGRFCVAHDPGDADVIICATGFRRGFAEDPLLADLVAAHGVDTAGRWIVLDADCAVPGLSDGGRTLALAGVPAQWAFPAADTLAGAKYAARRFLRRVRACRTR